MRHPTNRDIKRRLMLVGQAKTPIKGILNDIIVVGAVAVIVRSQRTGRDRPIPYRWLRKPNYQGSHGCIVRGLQQILGL